jgi:hypothetical protein
LNGPTGIRQKKKRVVSNVIAGYKMRMEGRETKARQLEEKKTALTIELNSTAPDLTCSPKWKRTMRATPAR